MSSRPFTSQSPARSSSPSSLVVSRPLVIFLTLLDLALLILCGSSDEKCLPAENAPYLTDGTVWGGLGDAEVLEEVCLSRQALKVYNLHPFPFPPPCFVLVVEGVISLLPVPAAMLFHHDRLQIPLEP